MAESDADEMAEKVWAEMMAEEAAAVETRDDDCTGRPFALPFGKFNSKSSDTFLQNAEFIAHARQDIPKMLAEIEHLHAQLERLTAAWQMGMENDNT